MPILLKCQWVFENNHQMSISNNWKYSAKTADKVKTSLLFMVLTLLRDWWKLQWYLIFKIQTLLQQMEFTLFFCMSPGEWTRIMYLCYVSKDLQTVQCSISLHVVHNDISSIKYLITCNHYAYTWKDDNNSVLDWISAYVESSTTSIIKKAFTSVTAIWYGH